MLRSSFNRLLRRHVPIASAIFPIAADIEQDTPRMVQLTGCSDPVDCDLSYDDGMLDVQVRYAIRAEYGSARPPEGSLAVLAARIEAEKARTAAVAHEREAAGLSLLRRFGQAAGAAVARPAISRALSGGLALAMAVAVLTTNVAQRTHGLPFSSQQQETATESAPFAPEEYAGGVPETGPAPQAILPVAERASAPQPERVPHPSSVSPNRDILSLNLDVDHMGAVWPKMPRE